jgi:ion channel POLLUX/CASTOR
MSTSMGLPSRRRRLRFWFDGVMARGSGPLMVLLALVVLALIALCALIVVVGGIKNDAGESGFIEAGWAALMRTFDAGTMGGDAGWSLRGVGLIATIGGIFIVSALIGVITTGLDGRLESLRRGRGSVELSGHTLILGWSANVEALVSELAEANSNQKRSAVVILADYPKESMDAALEQVSTINKRMLTLTRTGSTANSEQLRSVGVERAKSVIVVSNAESSDADPDAVRTALAVLNATAYEGNVVVELKRRTLADSLRIVSNGRALAVTGPEIIAQVTAEVCRYHGMSAVYQELFDFDGDEIYFHEEPALVGVSFGDVVQSFETSSILGVRHADGTIHLAPAVGSVLLPGDKLVAVSEDDDTVVVSPGFLAAPLTMSSYQEVIAPTSILLLGWNPLALSLLSQLDRRLPAGSQIVVCAPQPPASSVRLSRCQLTVLEGDLQDYELLHRLVHERAYDNIAILCGRVRSVADDDSRNLLTLMSVRQIIAADDCPSKHALVVTELRDAADVEIAGSASIENFIVSDRLVALLVAQLSENHELMHVFDALFDATKVDLSVVALSRLGLTGACTARDAVVAGLEREMVVLGTVIDGVVKVNPAKSQSIPDAAAAAAAIVLRHPVAVSTPE